MTSRLKLGSQRWLRYTPTQLSISIEFLQKWLNDQKLTKPGHHYDGSAASQASEIDSVLGVVKVFKSRTRDS